MGHYTAHSTDSKNVNLKSDGIHLGTLTYTKWYSFQAEITLANQSQYQLEPKGFWDSTVELKQDANTFLEFKMGWKGIIINTKFDGTEKNYLLKLKGFLSSKYVLVDTDEKEILSAELDFKWNKLHFDYHIETSEEFDRDTTKELFLLSVIHCINYHMAMVSAVI